jgi:hypothetical protein
MVLTNADIESLKQGSPVEIDVPEVGSPVVLIRADRLAEMLQESSPALPMSVVGRLIDHGMAEDDAADPLLASYQS